MSARKATHIGALDGLRALACLVVVASHLRDYDLIDFGGMGYFGVMLFFSLSGFLMGFLYLEKPFSADRILEYAIARFSRIAPIYLAVILVAWIVHRYVWEGSVYAITDHNLLRHLLFSGDVSVFWSIPPEVQFYLVFIVFWGCWAAYRATGNIAPVFIAALAVFVTIVFGQYAPGTFVASKIQFFAGGLLAALARRRFALEAVSPALMTAAQICGVAIFLVVLLPAHAPFVATRQFEYYADLRLAILTSGLTWLLSYETGFGRVAFGNRVGVAIGAWSFSLYLLHMPILQLCSLWLKPAIGPVAAGLVGVALSISASWLSYRLLEAPLRGAVRHGLSRFIEQRRGLVKGVERLVVRPFVARSDEAA